MEVIVEYVRKLKQNHQTILYKDIRLIVALRPKTQAQNAKAVE